MDISFIIVNYNARELLSPCIKSIYETVPDISYEIILVDNGSSDGSLEMVREKFPDVIPIRNNGNRGFAAANNQALEIMKGRYALLLNTDAFLTENAVSELFFFMENHREAAIACGQLLNADGTKQNSIASFPDILSLALNMPILEYLFPRRYPSKRYDIKVPVEIDSGIGACLMVRKQAIDEVGKLDERYFFFFEETDWAFQMKKTGWKIYYVPTAFIFHLQGQTIGDGFSSRREFYRSRYQYFRKWHGHFRSALMSTIIFVRLVIDWISASIVNIVSLGANQNARRKWSVYSRLVFWHLQGCP
jgi:hypothetical protein